ncbi:PepSY domain-containing protein [Clostridium sp. FP2]|uniref:PepSY domain-containing protein n=1 Tax=Clostridium tagluense TaxID=360422 RepID=A0A401UIJ5_9CLOT|nr:MULTISPECIES: PepSY domain-containing protein [Clostridium]MBZ9625837.1 PepSY domain-containing protein [Clostridium sp. FP2]GCD09289.1 hypothetical protein Ctaglu_09120 [Clostridium tagluense]
MSSKKIVSLVIASSLLFSAFALPVQAKSDESLIKPPVFLTGQLSKQLSKDMEGVHQFFRENNYGIEDSMNELAELKSSEDSLGLTHIKTQQMVKDIPVFGNEYIIHFNQNGEVYCMNGKYDANAKNAKINKERFIGENIAIEIARSKVIFDDYCSAVNSKLYLRNINDEYVPIYVVSLSFVFPERGYWHFYINAEDGTIIKQIQHKC